MRENLGQLYERWDGHGLPNHLKGEQVKLAVRIVTLAQDTISVTEAHGFEAMTAIIAKRRGGAYQPELADLFLGDARRLLEGIDGAVDRETILALEPRPHAVLDEEACEQAYRPQPSARETPSYWNQISSAANPTFPVLHICGTQVSANSSSSDLKSQRLNNLC
jgi:hypothetical protein